MEGIEWKCHSSTVTDGLVVRAGVSVTWTVGLLSLSAGGHEFEPWSGRTWSAWYFCPKSYLNQKYEERKYANALYIIQRLSHCSVVVLDWILMGFYSRKDILNALSFLHRPIYNMLYDVLSKYYVCGTTKCVMHWQMTLTNAIILSS